MFLAYTSLPIQLPLMLIRFYLPIPLSLSLAQCVRDFFFVLNFAWARAFCCWYKSSFSFPPTTLIHSLARSLAHFPCRSFNFAFVLMAQREKSERNAQNECENQLIGVLCMWIKAKEKVLLINKPHHFHYINMRQRERGKLIFARVRTTNAHAVVFSIGKARDDKLYRWVEDLMGK